MGNSDSNAKRFEFRKFATPRIIGSIAIALIVLWALSIIFDSSERSTINGPVGIQPRPATIDAPSTVGSRVESTLPEPRRSTANGHARPVDHGAADRSAAAVRDVNPNAGPGLADYRTNESQATNAHDASSPTTTAAPVLQSETANGLTNDPHGLNDPQALDSPSTVQPPDAVGHPLPATAVIAPVHKPTPKGVAFVEAAIKPLQYELEERWWGWRANDLINVTDNVNNFQVGVLEVTRRTTVALAERISRTGVTASFDEDLEQAMNWFMVKASSFWFPSAESKYRDGLDELQNYLDKLKTGRASFYTRADNLIPLLASFEDLLGSCDENLVKEVNESDEPVGFLTVDDYFYYTQGVANSMATVLQAVHQDFLLTLESRHATELLHHAIVACERAAQIDPWIILDRNLSSIFANHRANMAAPISHARFYLGQLIKTLST